jgi:hypothetical protein
MTSLRTKILIALTLTLASLPLWLPGGIVWGD